MLSLREALAKLPDTAAGIAAYLTEQNCTGRWRNSEHCPIANYLTGQGIDEPIVDTCWILAAGGQSELTPAAAAAFITAFDGGWWPDLESPEAES